MGDGDVGRAMALLSTWQRLYAGGAVRVSVTGGGVRVLGCPDGLKAYLAEHGHAVVDGWICKEVEWRRT